MIYLVLENVDKVEGRGMGSGESASFYFKDNDLLNHGVWE